MKKIVMISLVLLVAVLTSGCASYYTVQNVPSQIDESKVVKAGDNDILITAFPILTKEDSKKYFDANLIGDNILAVHLSILNTSSYVFEVTASNLIIKSHQQFTLASLPIKDVYKITKRSWGLKSVGWFLITYGIGGPISAAHTASVNKDVEQDLKSKVLKLGDIKPKTFTQGFLWFKIPDEAMSDGKLPDSELKISIKKDGKLVEYNLPIPASSSDR